MELRARRRREWPAPRLVGGVGRGMAVKPDPGGFPQRKAAEIPSVSAKQMREIQQVAQEEYGLDILQIMENSGRATAMLALAMLGGRGRNQRVVVLAGGGNKGAAGLCAARNLSNWGCIVEPVLGQVESEISFAARRQLDILKHAGIVGRRDYEASESSLEEHLRRADLIIDALVGYGLAGPPLGMAAATVELAVSSNTPILALDVPTGVNATTGEVSTPAITASTTLALDLPKRGLMEERCRNCVGELFLADIGIPKRVHQGLGIRLGTLFSDGPIVRIRR